jgi:uroporphyrinogen decarboxylase
MVPRFCSRRGFLRSGSLFSTSLLASRRNSMASKPGMSKTDRIKSVLKGDRVDRLPVTFWHHFRLEKYPGEKHAEATLDFYRKFDVDLLKVMSDFPYPLPKGLDKISAEEDWEKLEVLKNPFPEQIKALKIIRKELKGEVLFVETLFHSWTLARKLSSVESVRRLKEENPKLLKQVLRTISGSLANHVQLALEAGASGIFLAVAAADDEVMTSEEYIRLVRESDLVVLDAAGGKSQLNILHMHGNKIHFDTLVALPAQVINFSVHGTGISLEAAKRKFSGTLMGGLDETQIAAMDESVLRTQIQEASSAMQGRRLILAPGCSVPDDIKDEVLIRVRDLVQKG